jgi:hypothetical protein
VTLWPVNELKSLIIEILQDDLDHRRFKRFYDYCHTIAFTYLRSKRFGGKMYFRVQSDLIQDIYDLATDSIAPLFEQDESYSFPHFHLYFNEPVHMLQNYSEADLFLSLKTLILNRVNQELLLIYKNTDPTGYRILRNINLAARYSKELMLDENGDDFYLYLKHPDARFPDDYMQNKKTIYYDDLVQIVARFSSFQNNFPKLLTAVLSKIEEDGDYAPALERCQLHSSMCRVFNYYQSSDLLDTVPGGIESSSAYQEYEPLLKSLLTELQPVILRLQKKNNLNPHRCEEIYTSVLENYFGDLLQDGYADYLPDYWQLINNNTDNYHFHKASLEYLIRIGKEKLKILYKLF